MTTETTSTAVAAPQAPGAVLAKPMSIKDTVLAQFQEAEAGLKAMADRYRDVVYAVTTPKGMKEAIAARADLRDNGRRLLTRTEKKVKDDVNELKEVMGSEVQRLIALVKPLEDAIDAQIKVEETRKANEKAERDRKEAERVAAHQANIDQLRAYVAQAEGQPLETIKGAIEKLNDMAFGAEWEEFAPQAQIERDNTVAALRSLVLREEQRIENEQLRAQLAALQTAAAPAPAPASPIKEAPALDQQAQAAIEFIAKDAAPIAVDAWDVPESAAEASPEAPPAAEVATPAKGILEPCWAGTTRRTTRRIPPAGSAMFHDVAEIHDDGARITLGQIKEHIAPLSIDAAGLETLGFKHVATGGAAKLYRACDLPAIVGAMVQHLQSVRTREPVEA